MPRQSRIDASGALHHIRAGFRDGRVAELLDLKPEQVLAVVKYKKTVAARSLFCFWATSELGISQNELGQKLKISQPAVSLSVKRGEQLVIRHNYSLKA